MCSALNSYNIKCVPGWSTSIESRHLSDLSVKLLKLVVLSERLKTCHKGRATSETYSEIAKLLFCISKFAEIKDTREQLTVAGLCAEAKSLVSRVSMWGWLGSDWLLCRDQF